VARLRVEVLTYGLQERFQLFNDVQARKAIRTAVTASARRGRTIARATAPVRTGRGKAAISSSTARGLANTALAKVYITGGQRGPAFYMYFQDQGTGDRHTRTGADRGYVTPRHFMEQAALRLDDELPRIMEAEIEKALAKAGLV
jgi:HK97 gp10 family phage protein